MTLSFVAFGIPQPQGSAKAFMPKGGRFPIVTSDNKHLKGWRQLVAEAASAALRGHGQMADGPVTVTATFYLPRPKSLGKKSKAHVTRPDVDKLARSIGDALTGVVFRDDAQIVGLHVQKCYAASSASPRAEVTVAELEQGDSNAD